MVILGDGAVQEPIEGRKIKFDIIPVILLIILLTNKGSR